MFSIRLFLIAVCLMASGFFTPAQAVTLSTQQALINWVADSAKDTLSFQQAANIVQAAFEEARKQHLDPLLILSVISAESRFKTRAKSSYGAVGLMQVVPRWHRDKIKGRSITAVATNVEVGTQILQDCLVKTDDNLRKAMRCYSGGASNSYHTRIAATHRLLTESVLAMQMHREEPVQILSKLNQPRFWHRQTQLPDLQFAARRGELFASISP